MTQKVNRQTVSIIIPVHNGGEPFRKCLASLTTAGTHPDEVIVVADGETDGAWRQAEKFDYQTEMMPVSGGPARARNRGAQMARGDILLFVDADVTLSSDVVGQVASFFENNPDFAAVIGSYDDEPLETNFLSQYKNLVHHYVHQISKEEASTFWCGCGGIRRSVFMEMGGFDESYRRPSIEDIELGYRLKRAGYRIRLLKTLQVKHLKHWGVLSLLKADFFYRALPWTRLILNDGRFINDLNLTASNRVSVLLGYAILFTLLGGFFVPRLFIPAGIFMFALSVLNKDLYHFLIKKKGGIFSLKAIFWHWLYFLYSGLAFSIGYVESGIKKIVS